MDKLKRVLLGSFVAFAMMFSMVATLEINNVGAKVSQKNEVVDPGDGEDTGGETGGGSDGETGGDEDNWVVAPEETKPGTSNPGSGSGGSNDNSSGNNSGSNGSNSSGGSGSTSKSGNGNYSGNGVIPTGTPIVQTGSNDKVLILIIGGVAIVGVGFATTRRTIKIRKKGAVVNEG